MKELQLVNNRGVALLDEEDFEFANTWSWCATTPRVNGDIEVYRGKKKPKKHNIFLKRVLMAREIEAYAKQHNVDTAKVNVDFKNHNTLDLRKDNLQVGSRVVPSQNVRRAKTPRRGIQYVDSLKGYLVHLQSKGKSKAGIVETELEAMNLWNHWKDEVFQYCHSAYDCVYIPFENIKIRTRDAVKQADQVRSIVKIGNQARNRNAKYYSWATKNKAFAVRIKGQFFGYYKDEEQAIFKVASLKAERSDLFQ